MRVAESGSLCRNASPARRSGCGWSSSRSAGRRRARVPGRPSAAASSSLSAVTIAAGEVPSHVQDRAAPGAKQRVGHLAHDRVESVREDREQGGTVAPRLALIPAPGCSCPARSPAAVTPGGTTMVVIGSVTSAGPSTPAPGASAPSWNWDLDLARSGKYAPRRRRGAAGGVARQPTVGVTVGDRAPAHWRISTVWPGSTPRRPAHERRRNPRASAFVAASRDPVREREIERPTPGRRSGPRESARGGRLEPRRSVRSNSASRLRRAPRTHSQRRESKSPCRWWILAPAS